MMTCKELLLMMVNQREVEMDLTLLMIEDELKKWMTVTLNKMSAILKETEQAIWFAQQIGLSQEIY